MPAEQHLKAALYKLNSGNVFRICCDNLRKSTGRFLAICLALDEQLGRLLASRSWSHKTLTTLRFNFVNIKRTYLKNDASLLTHWLMVQKVATEVTEKIFRWIYSVVNFRLRANVES